MYITKLEITSFGCFENRTFEFKDGFNLIYGMNESGKSTLIAFVIFMFYGTKIKKTSDSLNFKERYSPWNGKAMQGRVTFCHESRTYVLERTFLGGRSTESLYCLNTGEQIKQREILSNLGEYFLGADSDTFLSCAFYSGERVPGSIESSGDIITKLTNSAENSLAEVSYNSILETINEEILNLTSSRRKNARIPVLENKLRTKKQELFNMQHKSEEAEQLLTQNISLKKNIEDLKAEIDSIKNSEIEYEAEDYTDKSIIKYAFLLLSAIMLAVSSVKNIVFLIILSAVLTVFSILWVVNSLNRKLRLKRSFDTKFFTMKQNNDKIVLLTEKILSLETVAIKNDERYNTFMMKKSDVKETEFEIQELNSKLCLLKKEVEALELAKLAVTNAYAKYKEVFVPNLSRMSSNILSDFTDGKYDSVIIDDSLKMNVENEFGYKNSNFLSQGARHQSRLSMQLALSEIMLSEKRTPLFLDDALAFYDELRGKRTIDYLVSLSSERQIFFSTCRENEVLALKDKNINFINLCN